MMPNLHHSKHTLPTCSTATSTRWMEITIAMLTVEVMRVVVTMRKQTNICNPYDSEWQRLPRLSPSDCTDTEFVQQAPLKGRISPFQLAFGLWCENSSISRSDYRRLREVWQMALGPGAGDTQQLLEKLDTLKKRVRSQLPMLRLMRKPIVVSLENQPTFPAGEKGDHARIERKTWHYWYDPIDLVANILSAGDLTQKMHFGMAYYVDDPIEFWHSRAWGSSAITTSGQFAYSQQGDLIIPGDIVRLVRTVEGFTKGRVIFIGRDFWTTSTIQGQVTLTIQPVTSYQALQHGIPGVDISHEFELIVIDKEFDVLCDVVESRLDVFVD